MIFMITCSHITAFALLRRAPTAATSPKEPRFDKRAKAHLNLVRLRDLPWSKPTDDDIALVRKIAGREISTVHFLTPKQFRKTGRDLSCHVLSAKKPQMPFVKLGATLFCTSPEETLMQLCDTEDFLTALEHSYEFCGCYRIAPMGNGESGIVPAIPLTTPEAIKKALAKRGPARGKAVLEKMLDYLIPLCASPMETGLVIILILPRRLGGYGLPKPQVNKRVVCKTKGGVPNKTYFLDLYWPELNLALEYDSDKFHFSEKGSAQRDSDRRAVLSAAGIETLSVTRGQVQSLALLDNVAKTVAAKAGIRLRLSDANYHRKRETLHASLFHKNRAHDIVPSECYFS